MLYAQWLGFAERKSRHIALGNTPEMRHLFPLCVYRCIRVKGQVRGECVGNEHSSLADDGGTTFLRGREPVDQMINANTVVQQPCGSHHILMVATRLVQCLGTDAAVCAASHPCRQINIVGREILDDADIGDPARKRPLAAGRDLIESHQARPVRVGDATRAAMR